MLAKVYPFVTARPRGPAKKKAPRSTRLKLWLDSYRENSRSRSLPSSVRCSPCREASPLAVCFSSCVVFPCMDTVAAKSIAPSATCLGDRALRNSARRNFDREYWTW
jgi:hypothetical protein